MGVYTGGRPTIEYFEERLKNRQDKIVKMMCRLVDYPELYEAAMKLGAIKITADRSAWTTIEFEGLHKEEREKDKDFILHTPYGDVVVAALTRSAEESFPEIEEWICEKVGVPSREKIRQTMKAINEKIKEGHYCF